MISHVHKEADMFALHESKFSFNSTVNQFAGSSRGEFRYVGFDFFILLFRTTGGQLRARHSCVLRD